MASAHPAPPLHAVRPGATRLALENTGELVFLYDAAHAEAIRAACPAWTTQGGTYAPAAEGFEELAALGRLVAFETEAPEAVRAEVAVGPGLSKDERQAGQWLRPQSGALSLPSGRLCIETLDSLRLVGEAPTDPGAVVDVPPGDYVLTLWRVDRAAMGEAAQGWPDVVLVLTPGQATDTAALLRWPVTRPRWGAWRVQDDVAHGEVTWALVGAGTNLDAGAVARLGLRPGMRLEARLGPLTYEALYLGGLDQQAYRELVGAADLDAAAANEPDLARAYLYPNVGPSGEGIPALAFHDFTGEPRPWGRLEIGMPVEVRVLERPVFAAPDDGWTAMWQVQGGVLTTEVIGCGATDLVLGAPAEALAALGAGPELVLEVAGQARPVWLAPDERSAAARLGGELVQGMLLAWPMPHWELGDKRVLRLRAATGPTTGIACPVGTPAALRPRSK